MYINDTKCYNKIRHSIVASITACHAVDRRSIRRDGGSSFCIYSQLSIAAKISKIECVVLEI